jgi:two-component system NtrC family sensor kinase
LDSLIIMHNPFPTLEPIHLAYFFYGTAFLFLTFSIGTKNLQGSNLRIANGLYLLALVGLTQGLRQFIEIYPLIEGEHLTAREIFDIEVISIVLLAGSFLFLQQFGTLLAIEDKRRRLKVATAIYSILFMIIFLFLLLEGFDSTARTVRQIEILLRNIFGLSSGLIAAWGLIRYSRTREITSLPPVISRNLYYAGIVLIVYAFVATAEFSSIIHVLDLSKEFFRAGTAVVVAYLIVKSLNVFDVEIRLKVEKQARELVQAEKLVSLGKLAAGIAHEINNPLTNASLGIQLAKKKLGQASPQVVEDRLNAVEKSIDRAASIAQELLLFSRERETEFTVLDVNDAIQDALGQLKHKMDGILLRLDLRELRPVRGDRGKLVQVFINILSNAQEAMPRGGVISVSTAIRGDMVETIVSDTGTGIEEEIQSKVFDPFFTTKEVGSGTGLGMYISYGIIKQHHGTIDLSSVPGKGTTVIVRLPVTE